jgi:hypothetical protein
VTSTPDEQDRGASEHSASAGLAAPGIRLPVPTPQALRVRTSPGGPWVRGPPSCRLRLHPGGATRAPTGTRTRRRHEPASHPQRPRVPRPRRRPAASRRAKRRGADSRRADEPTRMGAARTGAAARQCPSVRIRRRQVPGFARLPAAHAPLGRGRRARRCDRDLRPLAAPLCARGRRIRPANLREGAGRPLAAVRRAAHDQDRSGRRRRLLPGVPDHVRPGAHDGGNAIGSCPSGCASRGTIGTGLGCGASRDCT